MTVGDVRLGFHHVGITVADRDRSVAFWTQVLDVEPLWVDLLDGPYLGAITGYDGIHLKAAMLPLPGGGRLEILEYLTDDRAVNSDATANVGNVHICLQTDDIVARFRQAVAAGARPISPGPVRVTVGPNAGRGRATSATRMASPSSSSSRDSCRWSTNRHRHHHSDHHSERCQYIRKPPLTFSVAPVM